MLLSSPFKFRIFWIGYSCLHFSVAVCYASCSPKARLQLILFSKSDRFQGSTYEGFSVHRISSLKFIGVTAFALLTGSEVWLSGISKSATSTTDLLCLRLLYLFKRLFFYDDGLAGCISDTYTWNYIKFLFPCAKGSITWDYPVISKEFCDAPVRLPLLMLKSLAHRNLLQLPFNNLNINSTITVFIESQAMDRHMLFDCFLSNIEKYDYAYYFPHSRKASVSSQYSLECRSLERHKLFGQKISLVEDAGSLEAALIHLIQSTRSVSLHCGCTSTLLLLLTFFKYQSMICKLQVVVAPDFSDVVIEKVAQSQSFYKLLTNVLSPSVTFVTLQKP